MAVELEREDADLRAAVTSGIVEASKLSIDSSMVMSMSGGEEGAAFGRGGDDADSICSSIRYGEVACGRRRSAISAK